MSPAKSTAQRNLMAAAKAGASFPKAKKIRASMSDKQLDDFMGKVESTSHAYDHRSRNNLKRGKA
jgi:hypothetical protein